MHCPHAWVTILGDTGRILVLGYTHNSREPPPPYFPFCIKQVCKVAPVPGETKVWQYIALMRRIFIVDCPGVSD